MGDERLTAVFNYTHEQRENIRHKLHPDCCVEKVCTFCGASEANLMACKSDLSELVVELFEEAACSAHNANIKSIGQFTNWRVHDRHARAFDRAARALAITKAEG